MGFTGFPSMARNHYAVWVAAFSRPHINNNYLHGQGQGGINLVHAYEGEVYNNTIDMYGNCGLRFGSVGTTDRLSIAGIVIRDNPCDDQINQENWYDYWSYRNKIYNNDVTMTADGSLMSKVDCSVRMMGFWIRSRYEFLPEKCGENEIFNNKFTAINLQDTENSHGCVSQVAAVSFEFLSNFNKDVVYDNIIQGNNVLVTFDMVDDYSRGVLVRNNVMKRIYLVVPAAFRQDPFENTFNWDQVVDDDKGGGVVFRDNDWSLSKSKYDYWQDGHQGQSKYENTIRVVLTDVNGNPITTPGYIFLRDKYGIVHRDFATTDANGVAIANAVDFEIRGCAAFGGCDRPGYTCEGQYNEIWFNPYDIFAYADCYSPGMYRNVTINVPYTESESIIIQLSRGWCFWHVMTLTISASVVAGGIFLVILIAVVAIILYFTVVKGKKQNNLKEKEMDERV